jgi:hypothetical protein
MVETAPAGGCAATIQAPLLSVDIGDCCVTDPFNRRHPGQALEERAEPG